MSSRSFEKLGEKLQNQTIDIVLPTYREKDSIGRIAKEFAQISNVKTVYVVNNNAEPGTDEEVIGIEKVVLLHEAKQGYGASIKRGLEASDSPFCVICEPDGTFFPRDMAKLIAYLDDNEIVIGSRTVSTFIFNGANMGLFLKWGNWAVAKLTEILFNTSSLTDVGCTFRVIGKDFKDAFMKQSTTDGSFYGLQMMLFASKNNFSLIQIPVHYGPRVGTSSVTGSFIKTINLGLRMIVEILVVRTLTKRLTNK